MSNRKLLLISFFFVNYLVNFYAFQELSKNSNIKPHILASFQANMRITFYILLLFLMMMILKVIFGDQFREIRLKIALLLFLLLSILLIITSSSLINQLNKVKFIQISNSILFYSGYFSLILSLIFMILILLALIN